MTISQATNLDDSQFGKWPVSSRAFFAKYSSLRWSRTALVIFIVPNFLPERGSSIFCTRMWKISDDIFHDLCSKIRNSRHLSSIIQFTSFELGFSYTYLIIIFTSLFFLSSLQLSWKKKDSASFQAFGKIKIKGDRRSGMV